MFKAYFPSVFFVSFVFFGGLLCFFWGGGVQSNNQEKSTAGLSREQIRNSDFHSQLYGLYVTFLSLVFGISKPTLRDGFNG